MEDCFKVNGRNLTIVLPIEVDHHSSEQIKTGADRIIHGRNISSITFDFKKTSFMDSSGIGMIMGRYKDMNFMGGRVTVVRANERIKKILTLSGIYKLIDICDSKQDMS